MLPTRWAVCTGSGRRQTNLKLRGGGRRRCGRGLGLGEAAPPRACEASGIHTQIHNECPFEAVRLTYEAMRLGARLVRGARGRAAAWYLSLDRRRPVGAAEGAPTRRVRPRLARTSRASPSRAPRPSSTPAGQTALHKRKALPKKNCELRPLGGDRRGPVRV